MQTSLVIPCYNEMQRLSLSDFCAYYETRPDVSLVFVDDGSTDGTLALLKSFAADREGRVAVISHPYNAGKAEAVRTGVLHILKSGTADYIGFMDADLATPFGELDRLLSCCTINPTAAIIFASRVNHPDAHITRSPVRRLCGAVFASAARLMLGIAAHDTQCGAKIIRTTVAGDIFREPFISRWLFDVELFLRAAMLPASAPGMFVELPLMEWMEKGASRIGVADMAGIFFDFIAIWKKYGRASLAGAGLFETHLEQCARKP